MGTIPASAPIVVSVPRGELGVALHFAAAQAAVHQCPVHLVHAYEPGPSLSGPPVTDAGAARVLRDAVRRAEALVAPGLGVTGELVRGPCVESVLDVSVDARVVVLQRRDLLHLIRSLTRSLDGAAVRRSRIPLVCVPPTWTEPEAADRPVTVGVDAPEHSADLLRASVTLAREHGAPLRVLHTWSFPQPYDAAVLLRVGREWEAWAREDIETVLRPLRPDLAVDVQIDVHHGAPVPALLHAAAGSRLMVLGRHGIHRAIGSRLGPVTRAVLHEAPCPVLLLPTAVPPGRDLRREHGGPGRHPSACLNRAVDAHDWDERYAASELVWSAEPNRFVAAELGDLTPGRALDLAAGEGRNAIWLARRGWQVTAADFSQVALDKGRRAAGDTAVRWVCADASAWSEPSAYDLVLVAYLQLPAEQRRAAVRAAYDSLVPGGTLFLVAHDSTNLAEGTGGPQDPAVLMTAEDVLGDLEGLALDVLRAERVARLVGDGHGEESACTAWDCLVRLVRR